MRHTMIDNKQSDTTENDKKVIASNRFKTIMDIILIIVLIGISAYVIINVEHIKSLSGDVCELCMEKTNSICITQNSYDSLLIDNSEPIPFISEEELDKLLNFKN